jgi:hypothetical protein
VRLVCICIFVTLISLIAATSLLLRRCVPAEESASSAEQVRVDVRIRIERMQELDDAVDGLHHHHRRR